MDAKTLDRANEIQKRLVKLETMRKWLENEECNVYLIEADSHIGDVVSLSSDMRTLLLGMCIGEAVRLQEEFKNL